VIDMRRIASVIISSALIVAAAALLAGCTRGQAEGPDIVVGAKLFGEQRLLAAIIEHQLERRLKVKVDTRIFDSTGAVDGALNAGDVDLYVEYTGTALTAILEQPTNNDPAAARAEVARLYAKKNLVWFEPLGFQNTFAIVIRGEDARKGRLRTITEAASREAPWRFGMGAEFRQRPDGFPGLAKRYRLRTAPVLAVLDQRRMFRELEEQNVDMIAANSTDGLLSVLDVVALEDDQHYFPPYEAAIVARREVLTAHQGLREALAELSGRFSLDTIRRLNYEIDASHRPEREVGAEFVTRMAKGPVSGTQ
jgi:osmoprotectant transport system substrate-binding protein